MSRFGDFFGRKPDPKKRPEAGLYKPATLPPVKKEAAKPGDLDPAQDPNLVQVFDAYGREMFMTKEAWRTNVLPASLQSNWNNPDQLFAIILGALKDGLRAEVIAAAEQLYKIDPQADRSTCIWGIILKDEGRLEEAEKVFRDYLAKHGENGSVLTNLAKVYAQRKEDAKAEETLWHALEVDPNQNNGLGWYELIHRERSGAEAGQDALQRVAALPMSWRAQLWLARAALQSRDLDLALALYQEALDRAPKPVPEDLLTQMSGNLGNAGHLPEVLKLTGPHFVADIHGLQVGNNLIKAHLDLAQFEAARKILDQLYALKRMDWQKALSYWDTEIAKARTAIAAPDPKKSLQMAMLMIEGPVWLKPFSPAAELFPAHGGDRIGVAFVGGTAEIPTNSKRMKHQLADARGRMSRVVPLFLAEHVAFHSNGQAQTLIPWVASDPAGFLFGGVRWADDDAANYARQGEIKSDYVVITHLLPNADPWRVELRLVRTIDGKCLGQLAGAVAKPETGLPEIARQLLALLATEAELTIYPPPPDYQVPGAPHFGDYLLRLEQLMAIRCAGMEGVKRNFLSGEREIINGNLQLCLAHPQNVCTRILLAQTLAAMKRVRPDILPEFKEKIALLQNEKPLPEPAQGVVQRIIHETLAI
jgi:tetratricopeptide (TPR) repeat protein